jgi:hypothetical protein
MSLGFVTHGIDLGPAGAYLYQDERTCKYHPRAAAIVLYQIDFYEFHLLVIPVGIGAH